MQQLPGDHLQLLSQLALEYQRKVLELEAYLKDLDPDIVTARLLARGELTTNQFRMAQQTLLSGLLSENPNPTREQLCSAAMTLCRCFDEMRILLQALAEVRTSRDP